jgi:hypothetical protein
VSGEANSGSRISISELTPIVLASLSLVYAIGLLIVNLNLRAKGISEVDLARPSYLLVGGLWTFLVATLLSSYYGFRYWLPAEWHQIKEGRRKGARFGGNLWSQIKRASRIGYFLVIPFVAVVVITLYITGWKLDHGGNIKYVLPIVFSAISAGVLVRLLVHTRTFRETNGKFGHLTFEALGAIVLLFCALIFYSLFTYPHIMRGYGGGYELQVDLVLSPPSPSSIPWNCTDIHISPDRILVGPALLVLETDSDLFLETDPDLPVQSKAGKTSVPSCPESADLQNTIRIRRESVATVLIVGNPRIGWLSRELQQFYHDLQTFSF